MKSASTGSADGHSAEVGWSTDLATARSLDAADPLAPIRSRFLFPRGPDGAKQVYLVGNSLGLATSSTADYVNTELDRWAALGVAGHFSGELAWAPYHRLLTEQMASIVGGRDEEVVVMGSLTANLHQLMISFYRPTPERNKILIEGHAFPSDHFAAESQIRQRGYDPETSLVVLKPQPGEQLLRHEDILDTISRWGPELALVLLPGVQYYTGQVFPMATITKAAHSVGAVVGFDLAHAAGNVCLDLHDWGVDFAVWCTYKYLNAGPGAVGGAFVHNRHVADQTIPKLLGWWGTKPERRFEMSTTFDPIPTAESWQVSNAPILSMAALRASLDVFDEAGGMTVLRHKSEQQIAYLDYLLREVIADRVVSITPRQLDRRGCQFALRVADRFDGQTVYEELERRGVACDWRHPDVIRVAPVPLYNSFADIHRFVMILDGLLV
jgi:kynureninase